MSEKQFADIAYDFDLARSRFEAALDDVGVQFEDLGWDHYDDSLEVIGAPDDLRLTEAAQRVIFDAGFSKVFVNHASGWETHYSWGPGEFKPHRGWRRRYVPDPTATTTNVIVGAPNPGYTEISYWPEGWGDPETGTCAEWLRTGYMRIVPDPLAPA